MEHEADDCECMQSTSVPPKCLHEVFKHRENLKCRREKNIFGILVRISLGRPRRR
jgi:hypothetical protein